MKITFIYVKLLLKVFIQLSHIGRNESLLQLYKQNLCFRLNMDFLWTHWVFDRFDLWAFARVQTNKKTVTMKDNADSHLSRWISVISHERMQETIFRPIFLWLTATAAKTLASAFSHLRGPAQNRTNVWMCCWAAADKLTDAPLTTLNRKECKVSYFQRLSGTIVSFKYKKPSTNLIDNRCSGSSLEECDHYHIKAIKVISPVFAEPILNDNWTVNIL